MRTWYVVEQAESHMIGEGFQEFTTDKNYAEYLFEKLTKKRNFGIIDYIPVMREATEEETALLEFDFDLEGEESDEGEEACNISSEEEVIADEDDELDLSDFDNLDDIIF